MCDLSLHTCGLAKLRDRKCWPGRLLEDRPAAGLNLMKAWQVCPSRRGASNLKLVLFMSDFDAQWSQPTHLTVGTDEVDIYNIKPSQEKSGVPVVLVPGWGGTPEMYRMNVAMLAERGRRTLMVKAPHGLNDSGLPSKNEIPKAQARRIAALSVLLDQKDIQQTDAIGHSEGCLDLVFGAHLFPARFHNLVLIETPGLFGRDTSWRLAVRFLADAVASGFDSINQKRLRKPLSLATREIASSLLGHPIRAVREVASIAGAHIQRLLPQIRSSGVGVSIIHGVDDGTFPMRRVQQLVTAAMVDGFLSVKGRHGQFQLEPVQYTKLADYALMAMDARDESGRCTAGFSSQSRWRPDFRGVIL